MKLRARIARWFGYAVCDFCDEIAPRIDWDSLRARGWKATTWHNPPDNHATFCPSCWADQREPAEW